MPTDRPPSGSKPATNPIRSADDLTPPARRLLEATIEALDSGGEGAVRVQEIADAADVRIPILYRHFDNRDGLLQAAQVERLKRALDRELRDATAAIDLAGDRAQFMFILQALLGSMDTPERRSQRWKRINVIGSTYGRPDLTEAVAHLQRRAVAGIAEVLRRPQAMGWLREGLDVDAFAAWFAGQALGRILIELGDTDIDHAAWNAISAEAVVHVLIG